MKYAAIVLRNIESATQSVRYAAVTDEMLSGGIFLDEIVLLSYSAPSALSSALIRLSLECAAVFLICDDALLSCARDAVSAHTGKPFEGDFSEEAECLYFVLPAGEEGVERVKFAVLPTVDSRRGRKYSRSVVRAIAAPAARVRSALVAAREAAKGKLSLHAIDYYGETRIELIYDSETPKMICDEVVRILASELEEYVYAVEDVTIAKRLFDLLKLRRLKLATAESFTAGKVGQSIVNISGASAVFYEGLNTYDNGSKMQRLGVSEFTLKTKGAVSSEVAYEMAAGLIADGHCDLAVATTGIAGPQSDGTEKPVGLCYIAVGTREQVRVFRYRLNGDRDTITNTAVNLALFLAYREIK